ncbi:type IV secretory system conjugative DNA transfer family protein [Sulfurospirillum diekertiae]|uniref:Type IV secretion system DNA-binding domain-containing protein n=1 Tax=Sulfurospirillum diekertiae TaxID=1854492 RepID=A0AA92IYD5_9BACT|nr:type IV secretion system DNA-binding domain-containing protein [Sulfurospirillum diekertiae]QIR75354.1 type IV secretion system DNA-binding domain-containing protein [Sulfurospirillum diekertiae]
MDNFFMKMKQRAIIAGFVAFFLGLLTTRDILPLPFFHIESLLPDELPPLTDELWQDSIKGFLLYNLSAFLTYFTLSFALVCFFHNKIKKETVKRGAVRIDADKLKKIITKDMQIKKDAPLVHLAHERMPIPFKEIPRNFLFLGKAGSGKTQGIFNLLFGNFDKYGVQIDKGVSDYGYTFIIYDRKPDFTTRLYRRTSGKDFLFNPLDKNCIKWNIFDDLLEDNGTINESMVEFFAKSLCPTDSDSKNAHFQEQAQAVTKAVLVAVCGMASNANNKFLIDFIQANGDGLTLRNTLVKDKTVIKYGLHNNVANALTVGAGGLDNQGNSVMATLNKVFRGLSKREFYFTEGNFSIKTFFKTIDENPDRRLFIVNTKEMAGAYTTYFSLFINLIFKRGTSLSQPSNRRIFLMFDEIQSLGSDGNHELGKQLISELGNFLAESRSFGYSAIVATQSLPQLEQLIKKEGMRELFQHLSNKFIFQYNEPDGAEWLSRYFNEQEIERMRESISRGDNSERVSETEEEKLKRIVLPSEFNALKPLQCFCSIGEHPTSQLQFEYRLPPEITQKVLLKELPFFNNDDIDVLKNRYQIKLD